MQGGGRAGGVVQGWGPQIWIQRPHTCRLPHTPLHLQSRSRPRLACCRACGVNDLAFFHGVEVARLLDRWHGGTALLAAGLLHESVVEGWVALEEVERVCGPQAARLCADYAERVVALPPPGWRGRAEALRRVRLYAAAYRSVDLALLAVAHMWHSVTFTVSSGGAGARPTSLALARSDAARVLVPLLEMLGMRELRDGLESYLRDPGAGIAEAAAALHSPLSIVRSRLGAVLPGTTIHLRDLPFHAGERANERGRTGERGGSADQGPHNLFAEVVAPDVDGCYEALQLLHHAYRPIDGAMVDTVAASRRNGHRSLQTAVVAQPGGVPVRLNVQIVTPEMDWVNRWGVAAFALERCRDAAPAPIDFSAYPDVWWRDAAAQAARLDAQPAGLLTGGSVVVFSPQGEPFAFETGSTVVDYAYSVHSDLAEQCQRFFVNGESVEPATVLRHLDLVELEHHPRAPGPTTAWLNAARTKRARTRIRRALRRQSQGSSEGQRIIEARLHAYEEYYGFHIPDHRVDEAVARSDAPPQLSDAGRTVGRGCRRARDGRPLSAPALCRGDRAPGGPAAIAAAAPQPACMLAQCCKPRPGDDITGLPNRRGEIVTRLTIHRTNCPRACSCCPNRRTATRSRCAGGCARRARRWRSLR